MKIYDFTVKSNSKEEWPLCADYVEWVNNAKSKGFDINFSYMKSIRRIVCIYMVLLIGTVVGLYGRKH